MLSMNALKSLVILSLVLTVAAEQRKKEKKYKCKWGTAWGCGLQDAGISPVDKEEWRQIPETFQDQDLDEEGIPDNSNNAMNTMDFEMKNRKRESGYKRLNAFLGDQDQ